VTAHRSVPRRPFGATGLEVSALGLGAGPLGDLALPDRDAEALLDQALDLGVNLIDTARSYHASEERIGRVLARRRDDVVISTKIGYGIPGHDDWTGACISAGVDAALARLRTDRIDVVHLHSCPLEVLRRDDVVGALTAAVAAGKVRVAAYSGDNDELDFAVASGAFGAVQTSFSLCDQRARGGALAAAAARGLGVIAKRPLANAPWRFTERPSGHDTEEYWRRWRALELDPGALDPAELALRFAAWFPGVHSAIAGTVSGAHLRRNAEVVARGPLPPAATAASCAAFDARGAGWPGVV
jgi:aryl-alcohol dehydrogenase-like predicted oxidoreductase